jgi:hypothetical protein
MYSATLCFALLIRRTHRTLLAILRYLPARSQLRRLRQSLWKFPHIPFHVRVKKFLVVKRSHFVNRFLLRPSIKRNPLRHHEHPTAISAKPAMYENLSPRPFAHQRPVRTVTRRDLTAGRIFVI